MFKVDYKELTLSFNEFHGIPGKDMPEYGEFCLLELKDGGYTAGSWNPDDYRSKKSASGKFIRGTADSIDSGEVARWHSLARYDLSGILEDEEINWINLGPEEDGRGCVRFEGFRSFSDGRNPKREQYCLLIIKDGSLAAGRWYKWRRGAGGAFIYAPALASHERDEVWAWKPLSADSIFAAEQEEEKENKLERKLNRNPSADPELFKYGTDVSVYYGMALEKLREEFPWATLPMMKKQTPLWQIAPLHGKFVFAQTEKNYYNGSDVVLPWTEGTTADEFIDFLCGYTRDAVERSDPEKKFKFGTDINVYIKMAFDSVKKDYRWLDINMINNSWQYGIQEVDGDLEFVRRSRGKRKYSVYDVESAERFVECLKNDYREEALRENGSVACYSPSFGHIEIHGWNLESYVFHRLKSGDYKVSVTAGDRTTGGSRDFFITPHCFEAETYEEFLDRYLEIVPEYSFGLGKKDLLPDGKLKKFLGY